MAATAEELISRLRAHGPAFREEFRQIVEAEAIRI